MRAQRGTLKRSGDGNRPNLTPVPGVRYPDNEILMKLHSMMSAALLMLCSVAVPAGEVTFARTPNGGIQPQAAIDGHGTVHLIYFKGPAEGGDVFYVRQEPGSEAFSAPIQVNSQRGSAIAVGTIRGPQLALGKNGRVHVAWNGGKGAVQPVIDGKKATPLLYARLNDQGTAFEPERNLLTYTTGLDGGGSVAADAVGNVYVAWHGRAPNAAEGEVGRAVYVALSHDEGRTFTREQLTTSVPTGACGCCGMRAFADSAGNVYLLFRAATKSVNRDEILLVSTNHGAAFIVANAHPWVATTCPMSSASLAEANHRVLAAWETADKVYFASVNPRTLEVSPAHSPSGPAKRKHPAVSANGAGETLLAWTEGTGWARGGSLAWQLFDKDGNPTMETGRKEGVPTWSLPTTVAKPDGRFLIIF